MLQIRRHGRGEFEDRAPQEVIKEEKGGLHGEDPAEDALGALNQADDGGELADLEATEEASRREEAAISASSAAPRTNFRRMVARLARYCKPARTSAGGSSGIEPAAVMNAR